MEDRNRAVISLSFI